MKISIEIGSIIVGKFQPKNPNSLREDLKQYIGKELKFEAMWIQEEGDPFAGQWVFKVLDDTGEWSRAFSCWVPEEDIQEITS